MTHSSLQECLRFLGCSATRSLTSLHRYFFYRVEVWGLASCSFVVLYCLYFWGGHWSLPKDPSVIHLQSSGCRKGDSHDFRVHGPIHWPLSPVKSSCTLSRKTTPKHVSISMLVCRDGILWVIFSIFLAPNTTDQVGPRGLNFWLYLTTALFLQSLLRII